jgi:hypothetical protein
MGNANSSLKVDENLSQRKCVFGCGGEMRLARKIPGGMAWSCQKCFRDIPKQKGDYTSADRDREYGKKEQFKE